MEDPQRRLPNDEQAVPVTTTMILSMSTSEPATKPPPFPAPSNAPSSATTFVALASTTGLDASLRYRRAQQVSINTSTAQVTRKHGGLGMPRSNSEGNLFCYCCHASSSNSTSPSSSTKSNCSSSSNSCASPRWTLDQSFKALSLMDRSLTPPSSPQPRELLRKQLVLKKQTFSPRVHPSTRPTSGKMTKGVAFGASSGSGGADDPEEQTSTPASTHIMAKSPEGLRKRKSTQMDLSTMNPSSSAPRPRTSRSFSCDYGVGSSASLIWKRRPQVTSTTDTPMETMEMDTTRMPMTTCSGSALTTTTTSPSLPVLLEKPAVSSCGSTSTSSEFNFSKCLAKDLPMATTTGPLDARSHHSQHQMAMCTYTA